MPSPSAYCQPSSMILFAFQHVIQSSGSTQERIHTYTSCQICRYLHFDVMGIPHKGIMLEASCFLVVEQIAMAFVQLWSCAMTPSFWVELYSPKSSSKIRAYMSPTSTLSLGILRLYRLERRSRGGCRLDRPDVSESWFR